MFKGATLAAIPLPSGQWTPKDNPVTAELDGGPAILQAVVPILASDDAISLAKRIQRQEHIIYPLAVKWFAQGKVRMLDGKSLLNGELLPPCGHQIYSDEP
ncbi:MAG: hypothetical protein EOP48_18905 [Sphingobacteriales bacterium]|nr:MAG: hypothetical protein EOP48_18905 [Sphingobacteriales bacterium]